MQKKKIFKIASLVFLVMILVFSPLRIDTFDFISNDVKATEEWVINQNTTWKKDDNILINKTVKIKNGATLTIEKGATIRFTSYGDYCNSPVLYVQNGNILAEGTKDENITFVSENNDERYGIDIRSQINNETSFFRYVNFEKGGHRPCLLLRNSKFVNSVYASDGYNMPTLFYSSGKVHIENSEFKNSRYSDIEIITKIKEDNQGDFFEIVNSNFSGSGKNTALDSSIYCNLTDFKKCQEKNKKVLLKNNWYGRFDGPTTSSSSSDKGEKIIGDYTLDFYRMNNLISDPVIIIPGIMGSASVGGRLYLDPIFKTYRNLINSLDQNGYQPNINLFEFPYEWRNSNVLTAEDLKIKIQDVMDKTKVSRVDLVAHSMGGLVARQYIESSNYQNNIDQLITLGTPHQGAPKTYLKWEAGEGFEDFLDKVGKRLFVVEAKHEGYDNLKEYIQEKVLSVGELLPNYDYLEKNGEIQDYPNNYPRNNFLEDLNKQENLNNLKKINFINIVNKNKNTISKFKVVESINDDSWEHGMPENFYDPSTDQGIEYDEGDGTVPFKSSTGISSDKIIEIDANHSQLPSRSQCKIFVELSNRSEENCLYIRDDAETISLLTFGIFSPIDIQVVSPNGRKVGKDFNNNTIINEIDGAFYTGFDTENEFITIPNPEDGEYKILTRGTDIGEYKIEVAKISENENDPQDATESTVEITGTATVGSEEELKIEVAGDEISAGEPKDTTPPIITASATTDSNENGWYKNDVTIRFTAEDNESGIEGESEKDVTILSEGENQSITETFNDIAGNVASKTVSGINIDKTAPETATEILGTKGENDWFVSDVEIKFSGNDNLSGVNKAYFSLDDASFEAGNSVNISNDGEHVLKYYSDDLAGNIESEKELSIKIDKTAPEIKIISPENKKYLNNENISLNYEVSDGQSGIKEQSIFWDAKTYVKNSIDLSLVSLGEHIFKIIAKDYAGNSAENQIKLNITTNPRAMMENVEHYFKLGLIKNKGEKNLLMAKLAIIEQNTYLLDMIKVSPFFNQKTKNVLEQVIKKITNNQIDLLIFQINHHPNVYDKSVKGILIECLNFVRI